MQVQCAKKAIKSLKSDAVLDTEIEINK